MRPSTSTVLLDQSHVNIRQHPTWSFLFCAAKGRLQLLPSACASLPNTKQCSFCMGIRSRMLAMVNHTYCTDSVRTLPKPLLWLTCPRLLGHRQKHATNHTQTTDCAGIDAPTSKGHPIGIQTGYFNSPSRQKKISSGTKAAPILKPCL